jgi:hypothetical protein
MSQAIYYIKKNDVNQNAIAQKNEALIHRIPKQALNIPIGDVLDKETLLNSLAKASQFSRAILPIIGTALGTV